MKIIQFTVCFLLAMFLCGFGCSSSKPASNPLVGFHEIDRKELNSNKALSDDYKDYIQKLPSNQKGYIGTIFIYENESGQHAVSIEIFEGNKNASWKHVLFYDKDNKRTKAMRYDHIKYQS
jgi:hypothetical protein